MVGSHIGPYKILRELREDSLGALFEAVDLTCKRSVAIRALNTNIAHLPETVARLHSEAKTLALLNHPHIARTFGSIRDSDRIFLVTEFLEGETLQSLLKAKHGLEPPVALAYFHQLLSAVSFAHDLGVIHGNLNPAKVFITHFGQVKVLDFARALLLREEPARPHEETGCYASPEQLRGEPPDERSDVYSLGALFYQCMTGRCPFDHDEAIRAHGRGAATLLPPSLLAATCPPWLDDFVLRALAPAASDRFQTATLMDRAMKLRVKSGIQRQGRERNSWRRARAMTQKARSAGFHLQRARNTAGVQLRAIATGIEQACRTTSRLGHHALVKMKIVESSRRGLRRMNSRLTATRTAMRQAHQRLLNRTRYARSLRSHEALRLDVLSRTVVSLHNRLTERWHAAKFGELTRGARLHVRTSIRRWVRPKFAALSESGWQRYAAFAIVLASAMIEIFVFDGANALLIFERSQSPAVVQHGAAESFIEPAAEKSVSSPRRIRAVREAAPAPEHPENTASAGRKPPSRNRSEKEDEYLEARVAKRVVTYRIEAKAPVLPESRVSEPPRSKRSDSPAQLNVKWEN